MHWISTLSTTADTPSAIRELVQRLQQDATAPQAVVVQFSPHHATSVDVIVNALESAFPAAQIVGSITSAVISNGREIHDAPALALMAGWLDEGTVRSFHLPPGEMQFTDVVARMGTRQHVLLWVDPYSFDPTALLQARDRLWPDVVTAGGLISGADGPEQVLLIQGGEIHRSGAVGVSIPRSVPVVPIVAQGCRPIGEPLFVTGCEGQRITSLNGRVPRQLLQELLTSQDEDTLSLVRSGGLLVGLQMRDQLEYHPGDFLIRNVRGVAKDTGALVIGGVAEQHQVVQFHVRDARAAKAELLEALDGVDASVAGGLLFSCLGRGEAFFDMPDCEARAYRERFPEAALGGMYCSGEIGPVQGQTWIHGYTSCFLLFGAEASAQQQEDE